VFPRSFDVDVVMRLIVQRFEERKLCSRIIEACESSDDAWLAQVLWYGGRQEIWRAEISRSSASALRALLPYKTMVRVQERESLLEGGNVVVWQRRERRGQVRYIVPR
jgi:hypothetical protein